MSKSLKAALLTALVFPGAGHYFLKKKMTATILAGIAAISLYLIVSAAISRANEIVAQIQNGEVRPDIASIMQLISQQPTGDATQVLDVAWALLIITWAFGIVDAYRVGRQQDKHV